MKSLNYEITKIAVGQGQLEYQAVSVTGHVVARMVVADGKFEGYSIVPAIIRVVGKAEGVISLLNWIVGRSRGPIVSTVDSELLQDYGFEPLKGQLVLS
jgi:hypothetical protein